MYFKNLGKNFHPRPCDFIFTKFPTPLCHIFIQVIRQSSFICYMTMNASSISWTIIFRHNCITFTKINLHRVLRIVPENNIESWDGFSLTMMLRPVVWDNCLLIPFDRFCVNKFYSWNDELSEFVGDNWINDLIF